MYKITICGHFGGNENFLDGQTVKTKNLYKALANEYKKEQINKLDTYGWKKNPISFFVRCIKEFKRSENVIILPAHNGVRVFIPFFAFLKKLYKTKVFYVVIGGWLPEKLKKEKKLLKTIKKIDKVFVETNKMKENLSVLGVKNVKVLVNFKNIKPLKQQELVDVYVKPYKVCTFSRVMEEKGIEDAIKAIKEINEEHDSEVYNLDIYGPIDTNYKERFEKLLKEFPSYINYKGCIDSEKSVETLKDYYLLLFPTKFYTEGIPGTIIDAFSAGIPVISARWENFEEIIAEGCNGYGYELGNYADLVIKLKEAIEFKNILGMKKNCIIEAEKYIPSNAIKKLIKYIE